jgi:hypothetical protein
MKPMIELDENEVRPPVWVQWAALIGFNAVIAVLFGALMWLMIWYGMTYGY